jgi:hypothetical protein
VNNAADFSNIEIWKLPIAERLSCARNQLPMTASGAASPGGYTDYTRIIYVENVGVTRSLR